MFFLRQTNNPPVLEISFDYWECIDGMGPYWDIVTNYAHEAGINPVTVDFIRNYKFTEDGHKIQFYWNSVSGIYIFYIAKSQYDLIYNRLHKICTSLNRQIAEKKYFEKHSCLPNNGNGFK